MPTTTLMTCREHDECVVELVLDETDTPLPAPVWMHDWLEQASGELTEFSHIRAAGSPDGLLVGTQGVLEARIGRLEAVVYRRRWWRRR